MRLTICGLTLLVGIVASNLVVACSKRSTQPAQTPPTLSLSNPTGLVIHYYATAGPDTVMERWPIQYQHLLEAMPDIPGLVKHVEIGIGFPPQTVGVSWRGDADSVVVEMMHRWEIEVASIFKYRDRWYRMVEVEGPKED